MSARAHSLAFHPQHDWLILACEDQYIRCMDHGAQRTVFEYAADAGPICVAPKGSRIGGLLANRQWGWLEMHPPIDFKSFRTNEIPDIFQEVRFSTDGRFLVAGNAGRVFLCDAESGTPLRFKTTWRISAVLFHPRESELLVTDAAGIHRHRSSLAENGPHSFLKDERIAPGKQWHALAITPDGRWFAAYDGTTQLTHVYDPTLTNRLSSCGPHLAVDSVQLSPDGRWLTTVGMNDRCVRVWEVANSQLHGTFFMGYHARSAFSNDGRWLAMSGERFALRETGTWKVAPALPFTVSEPVLGAAAFSPDSRILALVVGRFAVHLFDLSTFESLAVLRPPSATSISGLAFSPDGSQLAATGAESRVMVWNLKALKARLSEFKVAWNQD